MEASDPEDTVTMDMMMVAWVTGSVLISKTNFISADNKGTVLEAKGARSAKRGAPFELERLRGNKGSQRKEGSAGTIGLGTIFRTHGKAHDLQVIGKVSSK